MKKRKSTGRNAGTQERIGEGGGASQRVGKGTPRWLAPRPYFGSAVAASHRVPAGGSTGVKVTMVGRDLGIDKNGYRLESQKKPTPADNRFSWIHGVPNPPGPPVTPYTLPHDTTDDGGNPIPDNQPWPNYWTMVVKVNPPDRVDQITFEKHGDEPWAVDYVVASTDPIKGEIRVRVTAKVPTTAKSKGVRRKTGALIVAKYKGVKVGQANFYVIRPEFLNRKPTVIVPEQLIGSAQLRVCAEYEGQGVGESLLPGQTPPAQTYWDNFFFQWIDVPVLDQYWKPLDAIYAGTTVTESDSVLGSAWIAWSDGATYRDPVGVTWAIWGPVGPDASGYMGVEFFELDVAPPPPPPEMVVRPLPWKDSHTWVIHVAGWVLDNGKPLKRVVEVKDVISPSTYPRALPPQLRYSLKWA